MHGWMDGWLDGWIDVWMDRYTIARQAERMASFPHPMYPVTRIQNLHEVEVLMLRGSHATRSLLIGPICFREYPSARQRGEVAEHVTVKTARSTKHIDL